MNCKPPLAKYALPQDLECEQIKSSPTEIGKCSKIFECFKERIKTTDRRSPSLMSRKIVLWLESYNQNKKVAIASLTKIMTAYVALALAKDLMLPLEEEFYVSLEAIEIVGTSACLRQSDLISFIDLLHGLLLPSGNDAALVIAENFSAILKQFPQNVGIQYRIQPFIQLMNQFAVTLGMLDSEFHNPHGLSGDQSFSTCEDLTKICLAFLKEPILMDIVSKREYEARIFRNGQECIQKWFNTNRMLEFTGFRGMKTGQTFKAGPCLVSHYMDETVNVLIILLNCSSPGIRWEETLKLVEWSKTRLM